MTTTATDADRALKAKHRSMWAAGDYPSVAHDLVSELGRELVAACGVRPGQRVLDVAAGSGNAAIPAARAGAQVVAADLTPEMFDAGRRTATEAGVRIDWHEADAEALPYDDASFDTVLSCLGVMFAPHHQAAADELTRVCRPGGTIGLISWTPAGFIGQMFGVMKPYAPPPPPGSQPAPLWGDERHVRALLGDRVDDVRASTHMLHVDFFATPEQFRDYFRAQYGPTIAVYQRIADDREQVAALDHDLADLAARHAGATGAMDWEYQLLVARRC
ncbi:MAG TPA: methyltransferase domain-containing protein [Actinoplanes sp.]